jgi:hypothetical protein
MIHKLGPLVYACEVWGFLGQSARWCLFFFFSPFKLELLKDVKYGASKNSIDKNL